MLNASFLLAAGLTGLFVGGEFLVRGAASLGRHFGLSPLVSGLTIVAFGTSSPELAVSLQAALDGVVGLAVGNVVGSNICNIALVLGLTAIIRPLAIEATLIRRDVPIMIACSMILVLLLLDDRISRIEGTGLVTGMLAYLAFTVRLARHASRRVEREFAAAIPAAPQSLFVSGALLVFGLAVLILSSDVFVRGAATLATLAGVPPSVIGLSIVAIGTSMPEIATSVVAAIRGHGDMAVGNVIGSNIFNVVAILGVTSIVQPVARGAVSVVDLGAMLAFSVLLLPLMFTAKRINRWEGAILLAMYVAYMVWLLF